MIQIEINNLQSIHSVDQNRVEAMARSILAGENIPAGTISIAVVDDSSIHDLNLRYLGHDDATDVLSFVLERDHDHLDGEVIVSAETAVASANALNWPAADELLLYVAHGLLHLVGYDDRSSSDRETMRDRERHYLARLGLEPPYPDAPGHGPRDTAMAGRERLRGGSGT